jgi:hypothetical protein
MKRMTDSLCDLSKPVVHCTLALNLLCGLSPHYGHLKALIKRIAPFPTFHVVRNELLLEELTMESEAPAPSPGTLQHSSRWQAPSGGHAPRPPSTGLLSHSTRRPCGPSSGFHRRRRSSFPQGQLRGWRLHPSLSLRPGWRPGVAVILQPLDRDHLHVARSGPECLSSSVAGPSDSASLRRASDASLRRAIDDSGSTLAPAAGDPHLDALVPAGWRMGLCLPRRRLQHHGDDPPPPLRLCHRLRCILPHHPHCRHALSLSSLPFISSLLDRLLETVPLCWSPQ